MRRLFQCVVEYSGIQTMMQCAMCLKQKQKTCFVSVMLLNDLSVKCTQSSTYDADHTVMRKTVSDKIKLHKGLS